MAKVGDTARIKLRGLDPSVDQNSPAADQVVLIYKAVSQYALRNGWAATEYRGVPGFAGTLVMKELVTDLFPRATKEARDAISSAAGIVLRRTNAAACISRPNTRDWDLGMRPTWFVASDMPANLAHVARTTNKPGPLSGTLNEAERKLTPHEAGEDRDVAPVEVTHVAKTKDEGFTPEETPVEDVVVNEKLIEDVYEQIATSPVPVTIPELVQFTEKPTWAVRQATDRLLEASRITWREETPAEKRVRGGGQLPPARRSRLWWAGSGTVPERTTLPAGIEPMRSSRDMAQDRARRARAEDQAIYEYLAKPVNNQRTSGKIAEHTGLNPERVKSSLNRQVESGVLHRTKSGVYYHVRPGDLNQLHDWSGEDAAPPKPLEQAKASLDPSKGHPARKKKEPEPEPEPVATDLTARIHEMVDQLAQGGGETDALKARITELERENAEMHRKLDQFKKLLD